MNKIIIFLLLLAVGLGGYYFMQQSEAKKQEASAIAEPAPITKSLSIDSNQLKDTKFNSSNRKLSKIEEEIESYKKAHPEMYQRRY